MNGEVIHCRNFPRGKPFPCMLFYSMDSTLSFSYYYTRLRSSQKTGIMMFSGKQLYNRPTFGTMAIGHETNYHMCCK